MNASDPTLQLKPLIRGIANAHRQVIGTEDSDTILTVSLSELEIVSEIESQQPALSDFLSRHLSGHNDLSFRQVIDLVRRLNEANFLVPTNHGLMQRLQELSSKNSLPLSPTQKLLHNLGFIAHIELMRIDKATASDSMRRYLANIPSPFGFAIAAFVLMATGTFLWQDGTKLAIGVIEEVFGKPQSFLLQATISIATAFSALSFLQSLSALGSGAKRISLSFSLYCLIVPVITLNDNHVFLGTRRKALWHYGVTFLFAPMLCSVMWSAGDKTIASPLGLLAGGFGLVTLAQSCPLIRSPLVKLSEVFLVELNLLSAANRYLAQGIFGDLVDMFRKPDGQSLSQQNRGQKKLDIWTAFHATYTLVWLYVASLLFSDILIASIPELLYRVKAMESISSVISAATILFVMITIFTLITCKLFLIIAQNIYAISAKPLRQARRSLSDFRGQKIPANEAVTNFLMGIPILSQMRPETVKLLSEHMVFRDFKAGETIINQGDYGEHFFILAIGEAKITRIEDNGVQNFIDSLKPGDSFGEIALVQKVTRQASIHATQPCRVLVLSRNNFDRLFPEGAPERQKLSEFINYSRLVQESQALSYLTPVEIQKLLHHAVETDFKVGTKIIEEGSVAHEAYLIITGQAKVLTGAQQQFIANLARGDLFGIIALMKGIPRTATVVAETDMRCLRIPKNVFVNLCVENLYVGTLIAELGDQQLDELKSRLEAG